MISAVAPSPGEGRKVSVTAVEVGEEGRGGAGGRGERSSGGGRGRRGGAGGGRERGTVLSCHLLQSPRRTNELLSPVSVSFLAVDSGIVMFSCWSGIARPWKRLSTSL